MDAEKGIKFLDVVIFLIKLWVISQGPFQLNIKECWYDSLSTADGADEQTAFPTWSECNIMH